MELTPDEYYLLILSIDMGGQFFSARTITKTGATNMREQSNMRNLNILVHKVELSSSRRSVLGGGSSAASRRARPRRQPGGDQAGDRRQLRRRHPGRARAGRVPGLRGVRRHGDAAGRPPGRRVREVAAWWLARRGIGRQVRSTCSAACRSPIRRGAQRRRRAGRVRLRPVVGPALGGGAVEPDLLGGGARRHGAGAGDDRRARPARRL